MPSGDAHLIQLPSDELRALLADLGVVTPPALWYLSPVVSPVSIVDSRVQIQAISSTAIFGTPSSAGETVNPAINTVLADTGQLATGNWAFFILISAFPSVAAIQRIQLQHRNAANAANIWSHTIYPVALTAAVSSFAQTSMVFSKTVDLNQRMRVLNLVGDASGNYHVNIFSSLLST